MSPTRICLEVSCPSPATYRGRCERHARERNRETRSKNASTVYSTKRWQRIRRHKLFETPICEHCHDAIAEHVHHIVDLQAGGDPWNPDNLAALCASCHNRTTAKRLRGEGG